MENAIVTVLVIVVVLLLLFLILREVMCWYWKVNERILLQKETNRLLRKLIDNNESNPKTESTSSVNKEKISKKIFCPYCGHENDIGNEHCLNCNKNLNS